MHVLLESKIDFTLINEDTNKVIKTWKIQPHESSESCLGKYEAIDLIKKLEKIPWLDINERIKKVR